MLYVLVKVSTRPSTLPDIVNEECVERLIEHEAQPSALLCLETHSEFTIYPVEYEFRRVFKLV